MFKTEFLTEAEQLKVMGGTSTDFQDDSTISLWLGCKKHKWRDCRKFCSSY